MYTCIKILLPVSMITSSNSWFDQGIPAVNREQTWSHLHLLKMENLIIIIKEGGSLVPRPPLDLPAFNVARKKREERREPGDEATSGERD